MCFCLPENYLPVSSMHHIIICISTEKNFGFFPSYATNTPGPPCRVRMRQGACLSKLAVTARTVGCCMISSRGAGSVRISYSASVDDVVGFQVLGALRLDNSEHVYAYGGITSCPVGRSHRSSNKKIVVQASLPCQAYRSYRSSTNTKLQFKRRYHVQYVGHIGLVPLRALLFTWRYHCMSIMLFTYDTFSTDGTYICRAWACVCVFV